MRFATFLIHVVAFNAMAFGNGCVMIPLVRKSFVGDWGILTEEQLLFSFTIAQVVPGQANLYVSAIGYMLFGLKGAFLSIVAINLPGYLMLPLIRCHERWRGNPAVQHFTRGLTSASVGLIFAAAVGIARHTLTQPICWVVFLAALAFSQVLRWNPMLSLLVSSGAGILFLACV